MPAEASSATSASKRHIRRVRKVQEHMPPAVGQGEQLAAAQPGRQFRRGPVGFDPQLGAGHDAQRHPLLFQQALEGLGLPANGWAVIGEGAQLMRRGHHGRKAVGGRQPGHGQGLGGVGGAVVDGRENMAVDVNQRHAWSLRCLRAVAHARVVGKGRGPGSTAPWWRRARPRDKSPRHPAGPWAGRPK